MIDFLFILEIIAVITGVYSVWLTKKENVMLYPVGILSVTLWIYLCWVGNLFGQSIINVFFFVMNLYGWYNWQSKDNSRQLKIRINKNNFIENLMVILAIIFLSAIIYLAISKFQIENANQFFVVLESIITGMNFVAMWLMAWKRIEHWFLWIIGDMMCIPLFIYKDYTIGVIQFTVFVVLAYLGYKDWKMKLKNA